MIEFNVRSENSNKMSQSPNKQNKQKENLKLNNTIGKVDKQDRVEIETSISLHAITIDLQQVNKRTSLYTMRPKPLCMTEQISYNHEPSPYHNGRC